MDPQDPPNDYISEDQPQDGVGRLVVMWLCWVLLVVMLIAAGVAATA